MILARKKKKHYHDIGDGPYESWHVALISYWGQTTQAVTCDINTLLGTGHIKHGI